MCVCGGGGGGGSFSDFKSILFSQSFKGKTVPNSISTDQDGIIFSVTVEISDYDGSCVQRLLPDPWHRTIRIFK